MLKGAAWNKKSQFLFIAFKYKLYTRFGAMKFTKKADPDKYSCSDYVIGSLDQS